MRWWIGDRSLCGSKNCIYLVQQTSHCLGKIRLCVKKLPLASFPIVIRWTNAFATGNKCSQPCIYHLKLISIFTEKEELRESSLLAGGNRVSFIKTVRFQNVKVDVRYFRAGEPAQWSVILQALQKLVITLAMGTMAKWNTVYDWRGGFLRGKTDSNDTL